MPLTNAEIQARYRTRLRTQLKRYEAALHEIAGRGGKAAEIANRALSGE